MNLCVSSLLIFLLAQICMASDVDNLEDDEKVMREKRGVKKGCRRCDYAYYDNTISILPPKYPACLVNVGGCKPVICKKNNNKKCKKICRAKTKVKEVTCPPFQQKFRVNVVDKCRCKKRKRLTIKGRVIQRNGDGLVTGVADATLSVRNYKKKTFISTDLGFFSMKLKLKKFKLNKKPKTFPKRISITARKEGLLYSIKHITITNEIINEILNVEIVLFDRPIQETFRPEHGITLHTSNAASVRVPENTVFKDSNGNTAGGPIRTMFKFIDPDTREFEDSPGEFIDSDGRQLMSFGVFTQVFEDEAGNRLLPDRNIEVEISDPDVKNMRLYKMTKKGQWQKLMGGSARRKRQASAGNVGNFGPGEVGEWLNIDDEEIEERCYVKMRVFEDNTFTTQVNDAQGDLYFYPNVLLKVHVGFSVLGFYLNPVETDSPSQHCYTVRCTNNAPITGEIRLFARQTIGSSGQPTLTRPVSANNPSIPPDLLALNYENDVIFKRARLNFDFPPNGPLFEEEDQCKLAPIEKSLWFALGPQQFPSNNFGNEVCFVRVKLRVKTRKGIATVDSLTFNSIWDSMTVSSIVEANEMTPDSTASRIYYACGRYECSKPNEPTQVLITVVSAQADSGVGCSGLQELTPDVIDADNNGYYYGQDENEVKQRCQTEPDPGIVGSSLVCSLD